MVRERFRPFGAITAREAAQLYNVKRSGLEKAQREGRLPAIETGGVGRGGAPRFYYLPEDVEAWLAARPRKMSK